MVTQSDLEREKYEARLKYQRDAEGLLRDATRVGEERGVEKGVLIGHVQLAEKLLKQELTPQATLRKMTLEQLHQLADRLESQLAARS